MARPIEAANHCSAEGDLREKAMIGPGMAKTRETPVGVGFCLGPGAVGVGRGVVQGVAEARGLWVGMRA